MITLHMPIGFGYSGLVDLYHCPLATGVSQSNRYPIVTAINLNRFNSAAMIMTLLQVANGTQVREAVDFIAREHIDRQYWRNDFPIIFYIHRSFSSIILFTNLWLVWKLYKSVDKPKSVVSYRFGACSVGSHSNSGGHQPGQVGVPPIVQPIHLLMPTWFRRTVFFLYSCLNYAETNTAYIKKSEIDWQFTTKTRRNKTSWSSWWIKSYKADRGLQPQSKRLKTSTIYKNASNRAAKPRHASAM